MSKPIFHKGTYLSITLLLTAVAWTLSPVGGALAGNSTVDTQIEPQGLLGTSPATTRAGAYFNRPNDCNITVSNTNDDGAGSLRQAIRDICDGGNINFSLNPLVTITLVSDELYISDKSLTITGPGVAQLTVSGNHNFRILNIASNAALTLTNLTMRDGTATSGGGGIYNQGMLRLNEIQLYNNAATYGGGVYVDNGGSVTLIETLVYSNSAVTHGGGIYIHDDGGATLNGGEISRNSAESGGGIYNRGTLSLSKTQLQSNTATGTSDGTGGGGVFVVGRALLLSPSLYNNSGYQGGGVFVAGYATLRETQLYSNSAIYAGGGIHVHTSGRALLSLGEVSGNTGGIYGGGVSAVGYVTLNSTLVHHNSAASGGGVYIYAGGATLTGAHVYSNSTGSNGGGVYFNSAAASMTLNETHVYSNSSGHSGGGIYVCGRTVLTDTQLYGNSATQHGGGAHISGGAMTLSGGRIADNAARQGQALYIAGNGIVTPTTQLTITGEIYQAGGMFHGTDHDLQLQGTLALVGGDFYAPPIFTLTGPFTHTGGTFHQTRDVLGNEDVAFPQAGGATGGVILNANNSDLGSTEVALTAGMACAGVITNATVSHCHIITPANATGRDATITLFYPQSAAIPYHYCRLMDAYRWDGTWDHRLTRAVDYGTHGRLCGDEIQSIQVTGVQTFSSFVLRSPPVADVHIIQSVTPTRMLPGQAVTFTLTFLNSGILTATGVVITDILPVSVTDTVVISRGNALAPMRVITSVEGTRYVWQVADLALETGGTLTISGILNSNFATTSLTNTALITTTSIDGDPTNHTATVEVAVNMPPHADAGRAQTVDPSTSVILDGRGSRDPNGDVLSYGWQQTGGTSVNFTAAVSCTTFIAPDAADVLTFTLTVTDSDGLSADDTVIVTVTQGSLLYMDEGGTLVLNLSVDVAHTLTLVLSETQLSVTDANGRLLATDAITQVDDHTVSLDLSALTGYIQINGAQNDDHLTLDFSGGMPISASGMVFDGGAQATLGDSLALTNMGTMEQLVYNYDNRTAGSILISDSVPFGNGVLVYTGLELLLADGYPLTATFNLPDTNTTATLSALGAALARLSGATFEDTDFGNPTANGTLVLNLGDGDDVLTLSSASLATATTLIVDGQTGHDVFVWASSERILSAGFLTVSVDADLRFNPGITLPVLIGGQEPGASHDAWTVVGADHAVTLTGVTLDLTLADGFTPTPEDVFVLIHNVVPSSHIVGTFAGLPEGAPVMLGAGLCQLSYVGGDGNDVVLVANTPPTISDIDEQFTEMNVPLSVTFTITDTNDTLWVYAESSNHTLVYDGLDGTQMRGTGMSIGCASTFGQNVACMLVITPTTGVTGTATITVTVDDNLVTASSSFVLRVSGNVPPKFTNTPALTGTEGILYTYDVVAVDPNVADTLAITATTTPLWLTLTDHGNCTATLRGTPGSDNLGPNTGMLLVSDGEYSTTQPFTITVMAAAVSTSIFLPLVLRE